MKLKCELDVDEKTNSLIEKAVKRDYLLTQSLPENKGKMMAESTSEWLRFLVNLRLDKILKGGE